MKAVAVTYQTKYSPMVLDHSTGQYTNKPVHLVEKARRVVTINSNEDFYRAYTKGRNLTRAEEVHFEVLRSDFVANRGYAVPEGGYVFRWQVIVVED
jgi:hypothetical protein